MTWLRGVPGVLLIALLPALAYAPSLGNEFAYDDAKVVRAVSDEGRPNKMVAALQPITDYFTAEYWSGAGASRLHTNPLYRPITVLSFALTHACLPGDGTIRSEARPHHVLNLLLHVINTLLVFFVVRSFTARDSLGPIVAASVFGIAAIHAEAVAAIVGRADLLAFGCGMGAVWCFLAAQNAAGIARVARLGGCALLLWSAFCAKESGLAWWPFLTCTAVASAWRRGAGSWRDLLVPIGVGIVPAALWLLLRQNAFALLADPYPVAYVANPLRDLAFWPRTQAALLVWGYSLVKMIVPYPLVCDYGASVFAFARPGGTATPLESLYLVPLAAVAGIGTMAAAGRNKRPLLFLGATALLGFGFVTSNIPVVIGTVWAERLAYLPSLGLALGAAWLFDRQTLRRVPMALLVLYLLASSAIVFTRVADWRDDATLFTTDVLTQPRSLSLRLQAAIQEQKRGDFAAWKAMLVAATGIEPEWARAFVELGAGVFQHAGVGAPTDPRARRAHVEAQLDAAAGYLQRARSAAILEPSEEPMLWYNDGVLMLKRGRPADALTRFLKILDRDPRDVASRHRILGVALAAFSDAEFLRILRGGERAVPGHPAWDVHRGLRAAARAEFSAARTRLESALPRMGFLDFTVQNAWLVLGELRVKTGDARGAHALFRKIADDPRFDAAIRRAAAGSL